MGEHPTLEVVDHDLRHLLASWFNRGFLVLRRIDWSTPANVLEKIIRYEAVHTIRDWDDLRRRLEPPDRRCFAFFHPQLVDEPLIFVEIALTTDIPAAIGPLLAQSAAVTPARATTAVFYSISNCQEGLRGISFGNFLIKQVVEDLKRELPKLDTFVTLSPMPGFAKWLREPSTNGLLQRADRTALASLEASDWHEDPERAEPLRDTVTSLAATYLVSARNASGKPVDPVARFHLGNGARLERVNFLGDLSTRGLAQSHGMMVNYLYRLGDIERNHEAFVTKDEVVATKAVLKMVRR
jgi:malonyl-CoA decarboxylase